MLVRRLFRVGVIAALMLPVTATVVGCSSSQKKTNIASIHAGEMPNGGSWNGVYYDQVFGYLHLTVDGSAANGAWRTVAGDAWGELFGEVDGDLLKYEWTQHKIGMIGANATSSGKGYFRYTIPKADEAHVIVGEWGMGDDALGQKWEAVKQKNMDPEPKSVRPDEIEGRMSGGGWDQPAGAEAAADDAEGAGETGAGEEGEAAPEGDAPEGDGAEKE